MKNRIVIGFILLGIVFIVFSIFLPIKELIFSSSQDIAKITSVDADDSIGVTTRGLDQFDEVPAKKGLKLRHLDIVKTGPQSETQIKINNNRGEFKILNHSEILIEKNEQDQLLVTVRAGDIFIIDIAQDHSFWIRKDGQQRLAIDYALANEKNADLLRNKGIKLNEQVTTLNQSRIEEILGSKKTDFFRCYGQLIQKNEVSNGQVLLSFEINQLGKVVKVEITRTEILDTSFKNCLLEVVARTSFPTFKGPNITTVFPLKFD